MENVERELGWNDEIEKESDFVLLDDGDYDFTIVNFERARHEGSAKLPACPKAIVYVQIDAPQGTSTIKHNLFLHTKTESMLSAFFKGIGQKKSGERLRMDWSKVVGAKGRCKVIRETFTKENGDTLEYNSIKKFYDPAETAQSSGSTPMQNRSFTPGKF
jgi:hypothetical protein